MTNTLHNETVETWQDYDLLDSGDGKTLERFSKMILVRPYPQAFWPKSNPEAWHQCSARYLPDAHDFGGEWRLETGDQKSWPLRWDSIRFQVQLGATSHIGLYPEEVNHWLWLREVLFDAQEPVKLLNLWANTGLLNLVACHAGANVTHVDSSKHGIGWAMANQKLSGMKDAPIRYIQEEPLKFLKREARREQTYNALVLQFPRLETENESTYREFLKHLPELLEAITAILDPNPLCLIVTAPICIQTETTHAILSHLLGTEKNISSGKLHLKEKSTGRLLPRASFSRWNKD